MTHKSVVFWLISSAILSLVRLWTPVNIMFLIFAIVEVACLIVAAFLNYNIFVAIRRQAYQVQALQVQPEVAQNVEMVVVTLCVYLAFLVCYLPNICALWISALTPEPSTVKHLEILKLYCVTEVLLNSSLNSILWLTVGKWKTFDTISWTHCEMHFQAATEKKKAFVSWTVD